MKARKLKLSRRQFGYLVLYVVLIAIAVVFIHEAAHILAAAIRGVTFGELKLGFLGINPSVTLPQWVDENTRTVIFYAGGLTTGAVFLLGYLLYWVRKYRREPTLLYWAMGLTTIMLAAEQFAAGYLEGHYHGAYIMSAITLFSPTDVLTYGWMIAAVFFHFSLCPRKMMKANGSQLNNLSDN
ncbi:MAG: hypothetical protein HXY36_00955 [Chloroflexi bacterium]|nr:hypothetical protein [Chloroflexota bacterium]